MGEKKDIYILGISAFYHDSAACLVKNGEIVAAAQEERFTRKKHDFSFPKKSIEYCFSQAGITSKDLSFVGFYDKPFIKFERIIYTYLTYAPFGIRSFIKAMPLWMKDKLFLKTLLQTELDFYGDIIFTEHHESHAASAFFPSPFKESAVMTLDGVGEWTTTSLGEGKGNNISLTHEIKFPHSLGLLYSAFTYFTGFRVNSGEYKLMGLAPYGEPKYVDIIKKELIDIKEDGSFRLNMKYFDYCAGLKMTSSRFNDLFGGPPRKPETPITQREMDLARSVQEVTEEIMVKTADYLHSLTKMDNLCLAGGVALNCVGNGQILKKSKFKNVWIQPAAGDAGGALGVALFIWYQYLGNERSVNNIDDLQRGSYLGPVYDKQYIQSFIQKIGAVAKEHEKKDLAKQIASLVNSQKVVGLFQGRMEFGPRALGARSIIGDARSIDMQSVINLKTKFRESFRPFAPSVTEEDVSSYFNLHAKSPYMLIVAPVADSQIRQESKTVKKEGIDKLRVNRSTIPAVTHVDYSARVQTVSKKTNELFYNIIDEFKKQTGCPVIINTSFNIRGEPIVCTPEDAYRCFMCTNMDFLVIENYIFEKEKQPNKDKYKKEDISTILD